MLAVVMLAVIFHVDSGRLSGVSCCVSGAGWSDVSCRVSGAGWSDV